MTFPNRWKENWELKSLTFDQLSKVVADTFVFQMPSRRNKNIRLDAKLRDDYSADSMDLAAVLLYLERVFHCATPKTKKTLGVPTERTGELIYYEDIISVIYEILLDSEKNMETFVPIVPNYAALKKVTINYNILI